MAPQEFISLGFKSFYLKNIIAMKRLVLLSLGLFCAGWILQAQNAWINELHYDNVGVDVDEMVEVVIENASSYTLSNFAIYLYNGNNGAVYRVDSLNTFIQGSTYGNFTLFYFIYPSNGIQNGAPDGLALTYQGSVVSGQFLSYEGVMTASDGPAIGQTSVDILVTQDNTTPIGQSLQLSGTGTQYSHFTWQSPAASTHGTLNNNQVIGSFTPDPEPGNHPTNFAASPIGLSVELSWTDAIGGQLPAGYLILASTSGNFTAPVDGVPVSDDPDLSDGEGALNVNYGVESGSFSALDGSTPYYFAIYAYTNFGTSIDYKISPPAPQAMATTPYVITAVDFEDQTFGSWDTISVASDKNWFIDTYAGETFAKISGYQGNVPSDDWLISPPLPLNNYMNEVLTFRTASNYTGPDLEVLISTDYTGSGNPAVASWTALPAALSSGGWVWTHSGSIDLSSYAGTAFVAFRYTSTATDAATWEVDDIVVTGSPSGAPQLALNELLAVNTTSYMDPSDNSYDPWIELYNPGNAPLPLLNWSLSDGPAAARWYFPDTSLANGAFLIVWADQDTNDAGLHTHFQLQASGGDIYLFDPSGTVVDSITYSLQYADTSFARIPSAFGNWTYAKPSPMMHNMLFPIPDTIPPMVVTASLEDPSTINVVFNEAVNATAEIISNYSGVGSIVSATLTSSLDTVVIQLATALSSGQVYTFVVDNVEDTSGNAMAASYTTYLYYGSISADLVITEIMYNPPEVGQDSLEFLEIYNNGSSPVPLEGFYIAEGFDFTFPNVLIHPGDFLVLAGNASAVENTFGISGVLQWTSGGLVNTSEAVVIKSPDGSTVDSVTYSNQAPWPVGPAGNGPSLVLCDPNADNTDPANWTSSVEFLAVNAAGDSLFGTPGGPCDGSGFGELQFGLSWRYYPVPAIDQLHLELPDGRWNLDILNVNGQRILFRESLQSGEQVDISALRPGFYLMHISHPGDQRNGSGKLIVK
jgi:hypothetical protein